jgi:glutaredoxin/glutathione-dependent peroxiredoxin
MLNMIPRRLLHLGQVLPHLKLTIVSGTPEKYNIEKDIDSLQYFSNKKVVLVGFPGAFTPTCTGNHLPEFIKLHDQFKAKGVEVVGLAVNDPFVLKEFGEELKGSIPFICDGTAALTNALEAGIDLSAHSLGFRTRRFTALVDNGTITQVNDEKGGALTDISKADTILRAITA